jgi:hypothetical protein
MRAMSAARAETQVAQPVALDYEPRPEFDTGRFVALYLQVLACGSIVRMVVSAVFLDSLRIDFMFLFLFWAAARLKRRSPTARTWVVWISGLILAFCAGMLLWATVFGTAGMSVTLGRARTPNPPLWQVFVVTGLFAAIASPPFFLLRTARARRQFDAGAKSKAER